MKAINGARVVGKKLIDVALYLYDRVFTLNRYDSFILVYHRVKRNGYVDELDSTAIYELSVEDFEEHVVYLKKHYQIVHLNSLVEDIKSGKSVSGKVAITFDDGFSDNYEYAYPVLKKHNVPATIYLMGDVCDSDPAVIWWIAINEAVKGASKKELIFVFDDFNVNLPIDSFQNKLNAVKELSSMFMSLPVDKHKKLLDEIIKSLVDKDDINHRPLLLVREMIIEMHNSGLVSFGGHSRSHGVLSIMNDDLLGKEIAEHREMLESGLGIPIESFSYPFGMLRFISRESVSMVKQAGYSYAVTGEVDQLSGDHDDFFMLPRVTTTGCKSVNDLKIRTSYAYSMIKSFLRNHENGSN